MHPLSPNSPCFRDIHASYHVTLYFLPLKGRMYFLAPWIWPSHVMCFGQQNEVELNTGIKRPCAFPLAWRPLDPKRSAKKHGAELRLSS